MNKKKSINKILFTLFIILCAIIIIIVEYVLVKYLGIIGALIIFFSVCVNIAFDGNPKGPDRYSNDMSGSSYF